MLCNFWAATTRAILTCPCFFWLAQCAKNVRQNLIPLATAYCSVFLSVNDLWAKIWHRNKTACSKSNPVQSSRSKSTTWPRKRSLLRFKSNSTSTSDGSTQKLGNDVRRDSESIGTKLCSQICSKWNAMFESPVVISADRPSFNFLFEHWAKIVQSENISTPIYIECEDVLIKGMSLRILFFCVWPWYSTWTIWEQQSCTEKIGCRWRNYIIFENVQRL